MKNVVERPTTITNHCKILIDLIFTNRKELVRHKGTCPLGISDHDMIYATFIVYCFVCHKLHKAKKKSNYLNSQGEEAQEKPPGL